jgi:molybdenum cofactor biosynthesis protein MoaC
MVPISSKQVTLRTAIAQGRIIFSNPAPLELIVHNTMKKGDVLAVARIAGIMAAKRTSELVPLCHPIGLESVSVDLRVLTPLGEGKEKSLPDSASGGIEVRATVRCEGKTGVEMEALTAVTGAALTVYDMCKSVDRGMRIDAVRVVLKKGGKSGIWIEDGFVDPEEGAER